MRVKRAAIDFAPVVAEAAKAFGERPSGPKLLASSATGRVSSAVRVDIVLLGLLIALFGVATASAESDYKSVRQLLKTKCFACHGPLKQESNLRLDTGKLMQRGGDSGPAIVPGDSASSLLIERVSSTDEFERMPPEGERLTSSQIQLIRDWVEYGSPTPKDEQPLKDPREHWAYQPLAEFEDERDVDHFIEQKLAEAGLSMTERANAVTLVRRLFLDLHGLPPTPQQIADFSADPTADAWSRLIDDVLKSPRYGERWGQHWLDIVRYADTHGFEVNTPRDNAWRYRDYVIDAFNADTPYDQFIKEQIVGDAFDADPATGFLVASAVLLPGQIGKDEESKRLARQDELDEMIIGTTATFLGMTMGCARCHDHKFDPLSQKDYYALQAFFAGVDFGERPIRDEEYEERQEQAQKLVPKIEELEATLAKYEPTVYPGRSLIIDDEDSERTESLKEKRGHGVNPNGEQRGHRDDEGTATRHGNLGNGRYTWWTNVPGEDTFTYSPGVDGEFRLWLSWGAHGSGAHTRDARYILDQDGDLTTREDQTEIARIDQYYLAGVTKGETKKQPLWSGLLDVGVHKFGEDSKVILRGGETGTAISADVVVLQELVRRAAGKPLPVAELAKSFGDGGRRPKASAASATTGKNSSAARVSNVRAMKLPRLRGPVNTVENLEHFDPVEAKFVRFTTFATMDENRHEPCLDELEVFTAGAEPKNVALAKYGAVPSSSGNFPPSGRHKLEHINDGQYGNGRSWISNEHGGGWVQIEFADVETISRIVWSRDRNEKLRDRLPIRYRIDISADGESWTRVTGHEDRVPFGSPFDETLNLLRSQPEDSGIDLPAIVDRLDDLIEEKEELEAPRMAYAGQFREPDETFLLRRGDPEQPLDRLAPAVPALFESVSLDLETPDQQRRRQLAEWIASPENPLTARVMVNRIWQFHFGEGIVSSASDFGLNGSLPTHPELLDWLAGEFIESGWSMKHVHRLILNSRTYQQSHEIHPKGLANDASCRLLWRFPSRRLEAEAIRDSMLAVSGELNLEMGGPGFNFFKTRGGLSGFPPVEEFGPDKKRRMIYAHKIRMESVPIFGAFDCPDAGQPMPQRSQSTTAIQALNLFNSSFVIEQSEAFAERVRSNTSDDMTAQINSAFKLSMGRNATPSELETSYSVVEQHGLATLCRVLFNSNEFLFFP